MSHAINTAAPACADAWVARQPVVNARQELIAYEILYRTRHPLHAAIRDPSRATSEVLLNVFTDLGIPNVVGKVPAMVNITRDFLVGELPLPSCPNRLVLEVLEDIQPDPEVLAGIVRLRQQGYAIALDDFVYQPHLEPLLELATIVKVDLPQIPHSELAQQVALLRRWPVQLLAEKVEDWHQFATCRDLGFELFQGHFLSRPELLHGHKLEASRLALLRILARVHDPSATFQDLEHTIEQVPAMCVKLLRYVNSSQTGLQRKVDSLHRALVLLGLEEIRTITTLLALVGTDALSPLAVNTAWVRAVMCRRLGLCYGHDPHAYFTAGLLSMLDVLMGRPLEEVIASLPLDENMRSAILRFEGPMGRPLKAVVHYEQGQWDKLIGQSYELAILRSAYLEAIAEAGSTLV
jgi:EAL and modified HD-GYP domain-containing signal transduction protein